MSAEATGNTRARWERLILLTSCHRVTVMLLAAVNHTLGGGTSGYHTWYGSRFQSGFSSLKAPLYGAGPFSIAGWASRLQHIALALNPPPLL